MRKPRPDPRRRKAGATRLVALTAVGLFVGIAWAATAGAADVPVHGELNFKSLAASGSINESSEAYVVGFPVHLRSKPIVDWTFHAKRVVVDVWTEHGPNVRSGGTYFAYRPPYMVDHESYEFHDATGEFLEETNLAYRILAYTMNFRDPSKTFALSQRPEAASIVGDSRVHFEMHPDHRSAAFTTGGGAVNAAAEDLDAPFPSLVSKVFGSSTELVLSGDFNLEIFAAKFQIRGAGGDARQFFSGWEYQDLPGSSGTAAAGTFNRTLVNVRFSEGTLRIQPNGRDYQLNRRHTVLEVDGRFGLDDAMGRISFPGADRVLDGTRFEMETPTATVRLQPAGANGPRVLGKLAGDADSLSSDGQVFFEAARAAPEGRPSLGRYWILVASCLLAGLGLFLARRRIPWNWTWRWDDERLLDRGEDALLRGGFWRAYALATIAVRRDARNTRALVLKSASLLKLGRPQKVVVLLSSHAPGQKPASGILLVMKSLALVALDRAAEAAAELRTAIRTNPSLPRALAGTELWNAVREDPRLRRYIRSESSEIGYT